MYTVEAGRSVSKLITLMLRTEIGLVYTLSILGKSAFNLIHLGASAFEHKKEAQQE